MPHPPAVLRGFYLIPLTKHKVSQANPSAAAGDIIAKTNELLSADQGGQVELWENEPSPLNSEISERGVSHLRHILKSSLLAEGEQPCQHCRIHGLQCDQQRPSCWKCQRFSLPCCYEHDGEGNTKAIASQQTELGSLSFGGALSWEDSFQYNPYENLERKGKRRRATNRSHISRTGRLRKPRPQELVIQCELAEELRLEKERLIRSPSLSSETSDQEHTSRAPSQHSNRSRLSHYPDSPVESSHNSAYKHSLTTASTEQTRSLGYGSTIKTTPPTTSDSLVSRPSEIPSYLDAAPRPFQCTFCLEQCEDQAEWEYHEEEHLPDSLWICMPWGPVEDIDGYDTCVFCHALEPREEHDFEHAIQPCYDASMTDRTFANKIAFQQHLVTVHAQTRINTIIHEWKFPVSDDSYYWNCGFCGINGPDDNSGPCDTLLSTWSERAEHIGDHFQSGMVMSSWDPYTPPYPLDRVTLACAAWFPPLSWGAQTLWDLERDRRGFSWVQEEYQCHKCNDHISFRNEDDRERHEFIWHKRREVWLCPTIKDIKAGLLAYHFFPTELEDSSADRDVCCFCKEYFPKPGRHDNISDADIWKIRLKHLQMDHHFGKCQPTCEFVRTGDLLLHLANVHKVRLNDMTFDVVESCRKSMPPLAKNMATTSNDCR
ncbi:hypothetical protein B0J14DRAFT_660105 [Halenospora varia]|nr:hypothetical protein B0J14DRAFT_660105 [Halenospora varia]